MITATTIGTNGRLGNQMFQYAALVGIARHRGYEFYSQGGRLFDVFKMHDVSMPNFLPSRQASERKFAFDFELLNCLPDNVDLKGYFQTKKYWQHCESEIINFFTPKSQLSETAKSICKNACFLHVRRTDYTNSPDYHTNLGKDYYAAALQEVKPKNVIVLSDDIKWCKDHFAESVFHDISDVVFADQLSNDDIGDLLLMIECKDAIIANSSFSWWGAYLGPEQKRGKVIAPAVWFGPKGPQDYSDIYNEGWIKL